MQEEKYYCEECKEDHPISNEDVFKAAAYHSIKVIHKIFQEAHDKSKSPDKNSDFASGMTSLICSLVDLLSEMFSISNISILSIVSAALLGKEEIAIMRSKFEDMPEDIKQAIAEVVLQDEFTKSGVSH